MAESQKRSETATQSNHPWTRGEKWLAGAIVVGLAGAIGSWAWMNSLERMPVLKIPTPVEPSPNGYGYFVAAAQATPIQWSETIRRSAPPKPNPHPERWLFQRSNPMSPATVQPTLAGNAAGLALLHQGLNFPCMAPAHTQTGYRPLAQLRHLARAVSATAEAQALQGHYAASANTALDGLAMGERIVKGGGAIDMLVGVACQSIDRRALWKVADLLDSQAARGTAMRLAAVDAQATPLSEILTQEKRDTEVHLMQVFEKPTWRAELLSDSGSSGQENSEQARALTFVSKRLLLEAYAKQMDQAIAMTQGRFHPKADPPRSGIQYVDNNLSPSSSEMWFRSCEQAADNRLLAATLALRAYRLDHGAYPVSLETLAPKYLPAVPQDPFGSGPLVYKVTRGGYLLYSIGPDGKDDGGKPIDAHVSNTSRYQVSEDSHGDIVAGLNE